MNLTAKERDCLLATLDLTQEFQPRLNQIAEKLGIKAPTALSLLRRLESKQLVKELRGMVILTEAGKKACKNIVLAHRSLETLFCKMGIPLNHACKEARKIDYLIEPAYAKKLWTYIGKPKNCPHGKPIIIT